VGGEAFVHFLEVMATGWNERFDKLSEFELERVSFYTGERYSLLEEAGKYNCARCGTTVYTSDNKFVPTAPLNDFASFREPATPNAVESKRSYSFGMKRTEALCGQCHLHLGYVFPDGAKSGDSHPSASERHCVLSICLNFVPTDSSSSIAVPAFSTEPSVVLDHLQEQDRRAQEIIDAGDAVQLEAQAPAAAPSEPSVSPQTKTEGKKEKVKEEPKTASQTRGAPPPKEDKKKGKKEEANTTNLSRVIVAPLVLTLIGSVIFYFAYKSSKKD
jgi:peptide-methionine (R)-S-oxide reductase